MRIWKYQLDVTEKQSLELPQGAKILTVQMQQESPQLWALVDEKKFDDMEMRQIAIYGTGNPFPDGDLGKYIATFQMHGGLLVFHAFEIVNA